ncbi:ABC transporter permease [Chryseolinea sp. T2]|uniref:ABC transporter permease n=1 Tax=Chryseolinea sp. T2 TaxID=3129255 RepID=UPI00307862C0
MIKNYLKIALRSLLKQRAYTIINVLGLSVGIASCLLITLFVLDEFSFDRFHAKADRIYKVWLERKYPNHITNYAIIPHSYADAIARDFPEVEATVRLAGPNETQVSYIDERQERKQFEEEFVLAADSNFFDVFSLQLLKGDSKKVLKTISDLVITEQTAKRYFGDADPVGKSMTLFGREFRVTGICENVPNNSHMKFDFLTKFDANIFAPGERENFITFSAHTYVLMKPGTDVRALEAKFPKMVDTYASAQIERDLGKSWEEYKREGNGYRYSLQGLADIHLDPTNIEGKLTPGGNLNYVYFLIFVAVLILTIACINFMNLATAKSAERAREVGVRKTMGSMKGQLVWQFLVESVLLALLSTFIAVGLAQLALPSFNELAGKHLSIGYTPLLFGVLIGVAAVVGFMAGSYPAFALSSIHPILVLKGKFTSSAKGAWLRNGLVVFQFFISIVLIVGTLVVVRQMNFMQSKSLGYDKEQVIVVMRAFTLNNKLQTYVDETERLKGVRKVGTSFSLLGRADEFFGAQYKPEGSTEILTTKTTAIDDNFAEAIGFEFIAGHGYSVATDDSLSIVLNESAVRTMDISDPIGKKLIALQRTPNGNVEVTYTIIGVIKDFNFQTLHDPITPLAIQSNESFGGGAGHVYVRVEPGDHQRIIQDLEANWKQLAPEQTFRYTYLDQDLKAHYDAERRAGQVFAIFASLAIIIACVGLFGLSAYTASLRTKEIGVRKVLGATVGSVVLLLSVEFSKLIVVALVLAIPASWYVMDQWLSGFAYRVDVGVTVFVVAGLAALAISWITVSYQSIKAAMVNPVKSLRSE